MSAAKSSRPGGATPRTEQPWGVIGVSMASREATASICHSSVSDRRQQQVIGVILVIVLLVGCGAPSATPPPPRTQPGDAPTVISEPPSPMQPGQPSSSPSPTQPGRPLQLPSPPQPAGLPRALTVALDAAVTGAPISPYIYGMFIEHQGRCIYGGIWAEMVEDRKFFYPRIASALHEMFRNSDLVFMANTHPVNVHGHVKTTQTAAAFEVTALPLIVYRHHFGTLPLTINGDTRPLDVAAAWTTDHQSLTVAVVNPTPQSYALTLDLKNAQITGTGRWWRIASTDPLAYNEPGQPPRVAIEEGPLSSTSPVLDVPPLSIILSRGATQVGGEREYL